MKVKHALRRDGWIVPACAVLLLGLVAGCRPSGGADDGSPTARENASGRADVGADAASDDASAPSDNGKAIADAGDDTGAADGSAPADASMATELAASVNGQPIPLQDFQTQALDTQRYYVDKGLDPNTDAGQRQLLALRRDVLSEIIDQALIEQESARRGITATNQEVEVSLAAYRQQAGGTADFDAARAATGVSEADVFAMERQAIVGRKFVEEISRDVPSTALFVHARHILCITEADCTAALARLDAGEAFETVAADTSKDEVSASGGGDLGWVPIIEGFSNLPSAELEAVIAGLQSGQRSGVVKTDFGFHIVEVTETDPARAIDPELALKLREQRVQDWLAEQHRTADVVIYISDLKDALDSGN